MAGLTYLLILLQLLLLVIAKMTRKTGLTLAFTGKIYFRILGSGLGSVVRLVDSKIETENQTFIKHALYAQLMTLEGRVSIRQSASAATGKVASASVCICAKPPAISGHSLPPTTVTQHKRNVC